jgi:hypothetical protein
MRDSLPPGCCAALTSSTGARSVWPGVALHLGLEISRSLLPELEEFEPGSLLVRFFFYLIRRLPGVGQLARSASHPQTAPRDLHALECQNKEKQPTNKQTNRQQTQQRNDKHALFSTSFSGRSFLEICTHSSVSVTVVDRRTFVGARPLVPPSALS